MHVLVLDLFIFLLLYNILNISIVLFTMNMVLHMLQNCNKQHQPYATHRQHEKNCKLIVKITST